MAPNIKTCRAHLALACLYGVVMVLLAVALLLPRKAGLEGLLVLTLFLAPCLLHACIAKGARDGKGWARRASNLIGFLMLLGFPIGTIIGLYLISNAWSDWTPPRRPFSGDLAGGWPVAQADA